MKSKTFFIIFKKPSLKQIKTSLLKGESPNANIFGDSLLSSAAPKSLKIQ